MKGNGLTASKTRRFGGSGVASDTREWSPDDKARGENWGRRHLELRSHQPGRQEVSEANDISSGLSQISIIFDSQGYCC